MLRNIIRLFRKPAPIENVKYVRLNEPPVDGAVVFEMATKYANEVAGLNMTKDEIMFSPHISGVQIVEWYRAEKKRQKSK